MSSSPCSPVPWPSRRAIRSSRGRSRAVLPGRAGHQAGILGGQAFGLVTGPVPDPDPDPGPHDIARHRKTHRPADPEHRDRLCCPGRAGPAGPSADVSPCAILSIPFVLVWIVQTGYPGQPRLHIEFE